MVSPHRAPALGFAVLGVEQSTGLFDVFQVATHLHASNSKTNQVK